MHSQVGNNDGRRGRALAIACFMAASALLLLKLESGVAAPYQAMAHELGGTVPGARN